MKIALFFKKPGTKNILLISVFTVLVYFSLIEHANLFNTIRLKGFDFLTQIRHRLKPAPFVTDNILIIEIDEESIKRMGKKWPWDRSIFADLMDRLAGYETRLICFDILFIGESLDKEVDKKLAGAFRKVKNVLLASNFDASGRYIMPLEIFMDSVSGIGFVDFLRDRDFVVRRTRPVMFSKHGKIIDYSFPLKATALYLGIPEENIFYSGKSILLKRVAPRRKKGIGFVVVPLVNGSELRMNYLADKTDVRHISFHDVVRGELPEDLFKDKMVVIGITTKSLQDIYPSPLGMMSGVLMNVNCILMLLDQNFIKVVPGPVNMAVFFLLSFLISAVTYKINVIKRELFSAAVLSSFIGISILAAINNYEWDIFGGTLIIMASYIVTSLYKYISLVMENMALKTAAITDGLTGLYVYKYFELKLRDEFKRAQKESGKLSLVIIDVDHFKNLNNKYGDKTGDAILKDIARIIKENCRRKDLVARYGGEEVVIILIDTGLEGSFICAGKIHKAIKDHEFRIASGETLHVTVSMGAATFPHKSILSKEGLIESADKALYKAKNTGRDKICISGREEIV